MKRLGSSDSLGGAFMSMCPTTEEQSPRSGHVYTREFQSMLESLDEEGCLEESGHVSEKKRRLSVDQVKALEKSFEVENKLEPERKVKLAQELGLQPRQVAVWFQNRRARWKTKQLERDYNLLKSNYDALKSSFDSLKHENDSLVREIRDLKSKLNEENGESNCVKEEAMVNSESDQQMEKQRTVNSVAKCELEMNYESFAGGHGIAVRRVSVLSDLKDGSSDSDSSAILNETNSPNGAISSAGALEHRQNQRFLIASPPGSSSLDCCFQFASSKAILEDEERPFQAHYVKVEEHNFFAGDEACSFFPDDPAPSLPWYCSDQWA